MSPQPHGPLRELDRDLFVVEGRWKRSPMGRRMSILRAQDDLVVHSVMRLGDDEQRRLEALGTLRWIVVPNRLHGSEAPWLAARHPRARVLAPARERAALRRAGVRVDGTLEEDWPAELAGHVGAAGLDSGRFGDSALWHRASRTLVLNDLCMNFASEDVGGLTKLLLRINGVVDRFGPSRLGRFLFGRDRDRLRASLDRLLAWDFDRVVVSHGRILESGGREALRRAFADVLGTDGAAEPGT